MRTPFVVLLLLLAGCAERGADTDIVEDGVGDATARFDLVRVQFHELNGSVVLRVTVRNYAEGLPMLEARLQTTTGDHFARMVPAPEKRTAPQVKAISGNIDGGQDRDVYDACWLPSFPSDASSEEPWWIFLEFLHNRTGLAGGGTVRHLRVTAADTDGTVHDEVSAPLRLSVMGGDNAYRDRNPPCPLHHERGALTGT